MLRPSSLYILLFFSLLFIGVKSSFFSSSNDLFSSNDLRKKAVKRRRPQRRDGSDFFQGHPRSIPPVHCLGREVPEGISKKKVVVVGMDGLVYKKIFEAKKKQAFDEMVKAGTLGKSLLYTMPMGQTVSAVGWSTMLTGIWPDKTGVKSNDFMNFDFERHPSFLTRLENINSNYSTYAALDWLPLAESGVAVDKVDSCFLDDGPYDVADKNVMLDAVRVIEQHNPDALFVYFGNTDEQAHEGPFRPEYIAAIETQMGYLQNIREAIRRRITYAEEEWTVMLSTDHGHKALGGHGGDTIPERTTFILAEGPGIEAGLEVIDSTLVDLAATVYRQMGIEVDPTWNIDGKPIQQRTADDFDGLYDQLEEKVDMPQVKPPNLKGFTHTPPEGWSVDSAWMDDLGITEWRGWSFTNSEFWGSTWLEDAGRGSNVYSRGVFAVADVHAWTSGWTSKPLNATFYSILTTKAFDIPPGQGVVYLKFATLYRSDPTSREASPGKIFATWDADMETHQILDMMRPTVIGEVVLPVVVQGKSVRFSFSFKAKPNDFYWAVDNVRLDTRRR